MFQPGDEVEVLPGQGYPAIPDGSMHIVAGYHRGSLQLEGQKGPGWSASRFRLVRPVHDPVLEHIKAEYLDAQAAYEAAEEASDERMFAFGQLCAFDTVLRVKGLEASWDNGNLLLRNVG